MATDEDGLRLCMWVTRVGDRGCQRVREGERGGQRVIDLRVRERDNVRTHMHADRNSARREHRCMHTGNMQCASTDACRQEQRN